MLRSMRCSRPRTLASFLALLHQLAAVVFCAFGAAVSGSDAEQVVDEADLALRTWFFEHAVATADHAHDLESLDRGRSCPHALEAAHPSDRGFQRAMIGLDDVLRSLEVRCLTVSASLPSRFSRRIVRGYEASLSVVIDEGGHSFMIFSALPGKRVTAFVLRRSDSMTLIRRPCLSMARQKCFHVPPTWT